MTRVKRLARAEYRTVLLNMVGPYRGRCGICGGPDARHRVIDAIAERVRAGDSVESVAEDYGMSGLSVREIGEVWHGRLARL